MREVEPVGSPETAEEVEIGASPTAAVEDAGALAAFEGSTDERRDEPAEPTEPEVTRFGARCRAQQMLHYSLPYGRPALYRFCDGSGVD